jgi:TolB-like protein/DNA-binding winged helix-turn-helix (wHTH) protein/tetratricopeptide (TPR) repeat protein
VDADLDRVSRDGHEIKVEPRAMRVLLYLVAHAGRNVSVNELLENVWPDVVVGPDSVYEAISLLRRTLGDDQQHPSFIAQIPRKGYRLIALVTPVIPVTKPEPAAESLPPPASPAHGALPPTTASPHAAASPALASPPITRPSHTLANRRTAAMLAVVAAIAALGAVYWLPHLKSPSLQPPSNARQSEQPPSQPAADRPSIAVLPFLDLSENGDMGYFADGMSEELIDALARNTDFHVPARTSSFYFKGRQATVAAIARSLNVDNVLEGSVRRSGNKVRVTAQLVRADSGYHLWSQTFDRELDDIFAVEDDIATAVVRTLQAKVPSGPLVNIPTAGRESHNLYLQCVFLRQRNTEIDADKAVACFQKLLSVDANDANVWAAYAEALFRQTALRELTADEQRNGAGEALRAAQHAIQLDAGLAAAHTILASYHKIVELDWQAADAELTIALDADPTDPATLLAAAALARDLGRFDQAIELCQRAQSRDPLNFQSYSRLGMIYLYQGRLDEAEAAVRKRLDLSPDGFGGHAQLADLLLARGEYQAALTAAQSEPNEPLRFVALALAYHALGRHKDSDAAMTQMKQKYSNIYPMQIADVYAFRGQIDQAFEWLNKALAVQDWDLSSIKVDRYFKGLRGDRRYAALLHKINLPE